eukprot:Gb_28499 [translate_table: standard]
MQDRGLKPPDDMMSCSRPLLDRRLKPHAEQAQKCPRCESTNTKFCYYNNYSLTQPRYFCKSCRRYWTKGGTLRNVPVGGGCRKNKRAKRTVDQPASLQNETSPSTNNTGCEGTSCPTMEETTTLPGPSTSLFYSIANEGDDLAGFAYARAQLGACNTNNNTNSGALQSNLSALGSLTSLNMNTLQSLKNSFSGLDLPSCSRPDQGPLNIADLSCIFEAHHQHINTTSSAAISHVSDGFNSFNIPVDALNSIDQQWRMQQHKVSAALPLDDGHLRDGQVNLLPFDESVMEGLRHQQKLRQSTTKADEAGNRAASQAPDWQVPSEGFFETGGDTGYWNGTGGTWPDLSGYGPSSSPLI